jgi:folate-dependent phosphoribosylglycinamide formyltransferase PurN
MKLKIGVLASGRGSNFSALLENSKKESSFFEVVL